MNGQYSGWSVMVKDDSANTGGYLILTWRNSRDQLEGYDDWVPDKESLDKFFANEGWNVEWSSSTES